MSGPRFVRFYASDWRSGCIGMTPEEEGFYIRVCAHFWETGMRIPLDDMDAASRLMLDVRKYRRLKTKLIEKGKLHVATDGLYSPRSETEYAAATRAIIKEAPQVDVGTTRGQPDGEHPNGRDQVAGREHRADTVTSEVAETSTASLAEVVENFAEKDSQINGHLKSHNQSLKEKIESESAREGVTETEDAIRHRSFVISLPAIEMAVLRSGWTKTEIRTFCKAHSLQWAAEIDAGKLSRDVLPQKIVNFLANSIMGEVNRSTRPAYRTGGRQAEAPRKRSVMDVLRDNPMPEAAA